MTNYKKPPHCDHEKENRSLKRMIGRLQLEKAMLKYMIADHFIDEDMFRILRKKFGLLKMNVLSALLQED